MTLQRNSLKPVVDRFERELEDIEHTFTEVSYGLATGLPNPRHRVMRPAIEGCVVCLLDSWGRFCRDLVIGSCRPVVISASGRSEYRNPLTLSPSIARTLLIQNKKMISNFSHGEPSWHIPASVADALGVLQPVNGTRIASVVTASEISVASGVSRPNPVAEIHSVRNLIAHRGQSAANKFSAYRGNSAIGAAGYVCQSVSGKSRLRVWLDDLRAMARLAAD